mgnify:FL=1|jgi:hypothetical protein
MKIPLNKEDLLAHFNDCLKKLVMFNTIYDAGETAIAKDIAVKLRILFHDTKNSKSLISQLKLEHLRFVNTADKYDPRNFMTHHGLLMLLMGSNFGQLSPQLGFSTFKYTSFNNWWNLDIVLSDQKKNTFTRSKIILELANTDGGAHVDPGINESYFDVSRLNSIGWKIHEKNSEQDKPVNDPIPPSIRQISYETLMTFKDIDVIKESKLP